MRNAVATGRAVASRFERVGTIARLRSGFLLTDPQTYVRYNRFQGSPGGGEPLPTIPGINRCPS